jgi:tetratricopeptide (TPR) repeat protein
VTADERDPVEVLAEEFADRCRRGEAPTVDEYVRRHPKLEHELRELLPTVALLERSKGPRPAGGLKLPERLGDFRILREVGRGGMGIVYEAEQESLGRRVALKVLPGAALLDAPRVERFHREAQAAARLHHTNIVPVFGVGEHEGLHYYVMQFIEGRGLNELVSEWREKRPRGAEHWAEIARLGLQVAAGLQHAHERGTLHRDIKPSNLLLDPQGTVWITDFGLAKGTGSGDLTGTGDVLGTLRYRAPESFEGRADARTDGYALGRTLYELVTLEPPFDDSDPSRLLRQVREEEPPRPRRRDPEVPRDLETIVLKAMAREPEARYASAGALAADLQRFIDGQPIEARRIGPLERTWRWCRRNRAVAALSATALGSLIVAAVVGWIGWVRTRDAYEREAARGREARTASERAQANMELSLEALEDIFQELASDDVGPRDLRPRRPEGPGPRGVPRPEVENAELLQSILRFYERFAERNDTNPRLQHEAARAHRRVGDVQARLGRTEEAEAAWTKAVDLLERLVAEFPDRLPYRRELAEACGAAGGPDDRRPDTPDTERRLRRAVELGEGLVAEEPGPPGHPATLARARGRLGGWLLRHDREAEAKVELERAIALWDDLLARNPGAPGHVLSRSIARQTLSDERLRAGSLAEARTQLERAIAEVEPLVEEDPPPGPGPGPRPEPALAPLYERLAVVLRKQGEAEAAERASRRADEWSARARERARGDRGGGPPRPGPGRGGPRRGW